MKIEDISRIYVVNLDRRPDRWERIQRDWEQTGVGLELTRWTACDGNDYDPPRSWDVGRGAFGCYLSHTSILVEMVKQGYEHVLILEDDATFSTDFRDKLTAVLADLPTLYDQCYLGYQLLHTDKTPPSKITENLGRGQNMNRNHGILYSRRGAVRLLKHLLDLGERNKQEHIDHFLGRVIHERKDNSGQNEYDCYISIPPIVYQGESMSDINGKNNTERRWIYNGYYKTEKPRLCDILEWRAGYGVLGRGDSMGYDGLKIDVDFALGGNPTAISTISLHAPSSATIKTTKAVLVLGAMNRSGGCGSDVVCLVDDEEIGRVRKRNERTKPIRLEPGEHRLEFRLDGNNAKAHTLWAFRLAE